MSGLKKCPFCGAEARIIRTNYHVYISCSNHQIVDNSNYHVIEVSADTEDEAIAKWNNRTEG